MKTVYSYSAIFNLKDRLHGRQIVVRYALVLYINPLLFYPHRADITCVFLIFRKKAS